MNSETKIATFSNTPAAPAAIETPKEPVVESKSAESTSTPAPASTGGANTPASPAKDATPAAKVDGAPVVTDKKAAATETPAYTANFEFLVDKEKKEIPEQFRHLIKDAATEKEVKEIFQKAAGLDVAKPRHEATKTKLAETETQLNGLRSSLAELDTFVKNKDLDSFFEAIGFSEEMVLNHALQLVQREKWTPQQRQEWQANRFTSQKSRSLERENATLSQSANELKIQRRELEVDRVLTKPEFATHAAAYDARVGKPGAFREEVWNRGMVLSMQSKQDVSPEVATLNFLSLLGINPETATPAVPGNPLAPVNAPKPVPVIPNVAGRAATPTRKSPRSIADLEKLAKEMAS